MGWLRDWFSRPGAVTLLARAIVQLAHSVRAANDPSSLREFMSKIVDDLKSDVATLAAQVEQSNANTDLFISGLATLNEKLTELINNPSSVAVQLELESIRQNVRNISESLSTQLQENAQAMGLLEVPDTAPVSEPKPAPEGPPAG